MHQNSYNYNAYGKYDYVYEGSHHSYNKPQHYWFHKISKTNTNASSVVFCEDKIFFSHQYQSPDVSIITSPKGIKVCSGVGSYLINKTKEEKRQEVYEHNIYSLKRWHIEIRTAILSIINSFKEPYKIQKNQWFIITEKDFLEIKDYGAEFVFENKINITYMDRGDSNRIEIRVIDLNDPHQKGDRILRFRKGKTPKIRKFLVYNFSNIMRSRHEVIVGKVLEM
jgi:hypothetical protein